MFLRRLQFFSAMGPESLELRTKHLSSHPSCFIYSLYMALVKLLTFFKLLSSLKNWAIEARQFVNDYQIYK